MTVRSCHVPEQVVVTLLVVRLYRAELLEPRAAVRARDVVCRARPARAVLMVTNHSCTEHGDIRHQMTDISYK